MDAVDSVTSGTKALETPGALTASFYQSYTGNSGTVYVAVMPFSIARGPMAHPYIKPLRIICLSAAVLAVVPALPAKQVPASGAGSASQETLPPVMKHPTSVKAAAYYHFSLGHLYEELAAAYGNRGDYVNKAIDNYRLAMREDPSATFLVEDIAELYRVSGRLPEAVDEAQAALKANPDDLNARRVLARIYTQQISDAQTNKIDETMAHKAIDEYKIITDKDPADSDSLVMLGRLDKVVNDTVDAEAAFKKAIAADPDNEDAMVGLAGIYSDQGDSKKASELLEKIAQKDPSARSLAMLANSYEQMKEYSLAADTLKKAVEIDPSRPELKQFLAQDLAMANRLDEALKVYQDLVAANAEDAQSYLYMSRIYRQQNNFKAAREMSDKAKQLAPDDPDVQYNEVAILESEGKIPDAIDVLKRIIDETAGKAEHNFRAVLFERLGLLYRSNDQNDLAVAAFRQMVTADPDTAARSEAQIVDTYRMAHDYTKAQQESDAASQKFPNDRTLRSVRAQLLSDEGKTDAAIAELKKSLGGKNDRDTYMAMADVYEKAKNWPAMNEVLDQADKLSTDKDDKANVIFMRGAMYERQKKYDLAEKEFRKVLDMDPTNAEALNYLGYMFADQGVRLDEAQSLIKRAVDIQPNNGAFLDSLGWVYYHLNRLDEAAREELRSVQLIPTDPTIHDHMGDIYFKQGKIKEAIDQWQLSMKEFSTSAPGDLEPDEVAKVQKKLDGARVRLAKEQAPNTSN